MDKSKCILFKRCVNSYPTEVSTFSEEKPRIERRKCFGFGEYAEIYPTGAIKLTGGYMIADMVIREVLKDVVFYKNSGGGSLWLEVSHQPTLNLLSQFSKDVKRRDCIPLSILVGMCNG